KEDYAPRAGSDLQGLWKGVVTNNNSEQAIYLKLAEDNNGKFRGECTMPDRPPVIPYPVAGINFTNPGVRFAVWPIGCIFTGSLSEDHSTMRGLWKLSLPAQGSKITHVIWRRVKPDEEEGALQAGKDFNYSSDAELQGHWSAAFPAKFGVP